MNSIDAVSNKIGNLESTSLHIKDAVDKISYKVDQTHETLIKTKISADAAHARLDKIVPKVEEQEKKEQRRKGGVALLSFISGIIGGALAFLATILKSIF